MPVIEYRGYDIRFTENSEEWSCYDIGYSHQSISSVKRRIDTLHRKLRKESAVTCFSVETHMIRPHAKEATIVEYIGPVRERTTSFERNPTGKVIGHKVAVMADSRYGEKKGRSTTELRYLYPYIDTNMDALDEAGRHYDDMKAAEKKMRDALGRMTPISQDQIEPIMQASGHKFTEGEV